MISFYFFFMIERTRSDKIKSNRIKSNKNASLLSEKREAVSGFEFPMERESSRRSCSPIRVWSSSSTSQAEPSQAEREVRCHSPQKTSVLSENVARS